MSRSNPHENGAPNPSTRWFEWNGEKGNVRYYDKEAKKNIELGLPFRFILLDQLGRVGGWHKTSKCRIFSNEVRDSRQEVLIVKTKKDGIVAEGIYKQIKGHLASFDGKFIASLYIAFKNDTGALAIGSLQVKSSALKAWSDFVRDNRADIDAKAVEIVNFTESTNGRITFRAPVFAIKELSPESNARAIELDKHLQQWLKGYFARTSSDRADQAEAHDATGGDEHQQDEPRDSVYRSDYAPAGDGRDDYGPPTGMTDDDIPF